MSKQKDQFIALLGELFQLNQPELDFGLYRILHARSAQIKTFIDTELGSEIDAHFAGQSQSNAHDALEAARVKVAETLGEDAFLPTGELKPEYRGTKVGKEFELAQQHARDGGGVLADDAQVYEHLYRFFSRYYNKGDFMSKRYFVAENDSRAAPYAVPYDGREVMLHWANKDQYYIKSSEALSNFTFDLTAAQAKELGPQSGFDFQPAATPPLKVHFRLAAAAEGEHNNVKEGQERFFIIHAAEPLKLETNDKGLPELVVQFDYRPDSTKTGQAGTWQQKRLAEAEQVVGEQLANLVFPHPELRAFEQPLFAPAPTDKQPNRTLLGKYLGQFTARNTMDYFIHKNLGGFLRRELDFYIKNEIIRLDDIEAADAPRVDEYLKKLRVLRKIARRIVDFLAQLEDFQKKLWLKKKFVVETQYCITLDRIPESFYPEIAANEQQREEWVKLFAIDDIKADMAQPGYSEPLSTEFLSSQPFLCVDTAFFGEPFKEKLLASINNLDDRQNGLLINSDNFQALRAIHQKSHAKFDIVYIDPPYNTGGDDFKYKDQYQHSSWTSMIQDRVKEVIPLLSSRANFFCSIDDNEQTTAKTIFNENFGGESFQSNIIIQSNKRGQTYQQIAKTHEYVLAYSVGPDAEINELDKPVNPKALRDETGPYELWELRNRNPKFGRFNRPNLYYPFYASPSSLDPEGYAAVSLEKDADYSIEIFPLNSTGVESCWRWGKDKSQLAISQHGNKKILAKQRRDGGWNIYEKARKSTAKAKSIWSDTDVIYEQGTVELGAMGLREFGFPKPSGLLKKITKIGADDEAQILDFFAGTGTTAQAAIDLNKEDGGNRKYTLVEMGLHFDTVLRVRIQKAIYASNWKNGKPSTTDGTSHCFKYLRLESFEDTLNNLQLPDTPLNRPWFSRHSPSSGNSVSHTLLETAA